MVGVLASSNATFAAKAGITRLLFVTLISFVFSFGPGNPADAQSTPNGDVLIEDPIPRDLILLAADMNSDFDRIMRRAVSGMNEFKARRRLIELEEYAQSLPVGSRISSIAFTRIPVKLIKYDFETKFWTVCVPGAFSVNNPYEFSRREYGVVTTIEFHWPETVHPSISTCGARMDSVEKPSGAVHMGYPVKLYVGKVVQAERMDKFRRDVYVDLTCVPFFTPTGHRHDDRFGCRIDGEMVFRSDSGGFKLTYYSHENQYLAEF